MMTMGFKGEDEQIILIGREEGAAYEEEIGQSLWLREIHGVEAGPSPKVDLSLERRAGEFIRQQIAQGRVTAIHDVSDGGTLVAIAEMALAGGIGGSVVVNGDDFARWARSYFEENQGVYVVTAKRELADAIDQDAFAAGLDCEVIGITGGNTIQVYRRDDEADELECSVSLADLRAAHESFFRDWMEA